MLFRNSGLPLLVLAVMALVLSATATADLIPRSNIHYSYGIAPSGPYSDTTTPSKLTDGYIGGNLGGGWSNGYVGWYGMPPVANIIANLGEAYTLDQIDVSYLVVGAQSWSGWDSWTVNLSNNADMSTVIASYTFTPSNGLTQAAGWYQATSFYTDPINLATTGILTVGATQGARYVQLVGVGHVEPDTPTGTWGFLSEVGFSGNPVPEPSSIVLLISACVGLLCYAWRRRK